MREALRLAAGDAGLWQHCGYAGFYVPGLGTVSIGKGTIRALERRGLAAVAMQPTDHEAVYADKVRPRGAPGMRVVVTRHVARRA